MERELPTINIKGTDFYIDVNNFCLVEKTDKNNYIQIAHMREINNGYEFGYGLESKNMPNIWTDEESVQVKIPELVKLDSMGMSLKYNIPQEQLKGKTDFEVMVDQKAFDLRMEGLLPTINIVGETFYVELEKDRLIPRDDPLSKGIPISSFANPDHVLGDYIFAYDPLKREIRELDYLTIKDLPRDLIAISLPYAFRLDPVGWNIMNERDPKFGLKTIGINMRFNAPEIPWEKTDLPDMIRENVAEEKQRQREQKRAKSLQNGYKKGRRM